MAEDQAAYDKVYEAEMEKLDSGAAPAITPEKKPEPIELLPEPEKEPAAIETEKAPVDVEALQQRLESTEKALKDTKQWATQNAMSLRAIENQIRDSERAKKRPEILDAFDGLEDAIKHVAQVPEPQQDQHQAQQVWRGAVEHALPDIAKLLMEPAFMELAGKKRDEMGNDWFNPISAIRELGNLRSDHLRNQAVSTAVEAARRDFAASQKKQAAMAVPGGSGKPGSIATEKDWANMSDEEFRKEQARAIGF